MLSLILTLHLASVRYYPDALLIHSRTLKKDSQKLLINALYFSVFFFFFGLSMLQEEPKDWQTGCFVCRAVPPLQS